MKSDNYILDFKKSTKVLAATVYYTRKLLLDENKIVVTRHFPLPSKETLTLLEGKDRLNYSLTSDEEKSMKATGRFLDESYEEVIGNAEISEKGLWIESALLKISDRTFVTTKFLKHLTTKETLAVIQENIEILSREDFEREVQEL